MHKGFPHPHDEKKRIAKLGLPNLKGKFDYRQSFHGKKPGFDLGDIIGKKSIWKGKEGASSKLKDPSLFEMVSKKEHPLADFLKDVDDKYSGKAITQLYDELIDGIPSSVTPRIESLRDRSTWHQPFPKYELPDFVKKIAERDEKGAGFAKRWREREEKKYSEDMLGFTPTYGKERPRGDYHHEYIKRIPGAKKGEQLYTREALRERKRPMIHVEPGSIDTVIAELAHYVQRKDMNPEELEYLHSKAGEDRKLHGDPGMYKVKDSHEWEAHSSIEPQLWHRYESLMKMYKDLDAKPLKLRR